MITKTLKSIDPGVSVAGTLVGTRRLHQFANRNPKIGMRSSSYTHSEAVLFRLTRLVTINSAIEVDLTGQVNAEQIGAQYLGGTGGQADYVHAGTVRLTADPSSFCGQRPRAARSVADRVRLTGSPPTYSCPGEQYRGNTAHHLRA